jgi:conjugative transfer signal peptidase TraF
MKRLLGLALILFTLAGSLGAAGARVNITRSVPRGLYWLTDKSPRRGDMVLFCPPGAAVFTEAVVRGYVPAGSCPAGSVSLFKRIVAESGDAVDLNAAGVTINGAPLEHSAPIAQDGLGRALPVLRLATVLRPGEVLLMATDPASFDGRYFGPVSARFLVGAVRPVWTF